MLGVSLAHVLRSFQLPSPFKGGCTPSAHPNTFIPDILVNSFHELVDVQTGASTIFALVPLLFQPFKPQLKSSTINTEIWILSGAECLEGGP